MTTIEAAKDFVGIGTLAGQLGTTVRVIERTVGRLGMAPAMRLNSVVYFDAGQAEAISEAIKEGKQ